MKIESIYHSKEARRKECKGDNPERRYSKDPVHHPLLLEREYVRALNAAKLGRMFAKPFITALTHHKEGVNKLAKDGNVFVSSSYDSKVVVWDLFSRKVIREVQYGEIVNGVAVSSECVASSEICATTSKCGTSNEISVPHGLFVSQGKRVVGPGMDYPVESTISSIDLMDRSLCVGHRDGVAMFDITRSTAKASYDSDGITSVEYNRSFKYIVAGIDMMKISLYDTRSSKCFLNVEQVGNNCVSFSPQQGYLFACGNEDGNGYLYDIRNSSRPVGTYRGHTNAVVSVAFSPDGKEIATGSFDRTIRLFKVDDRKPRDCYYNDRMQIVHAVEYSNDGEFIISGSDDGALRIWKAVAGKKVGAVSRFEKESLEYAEALKEKFKHVGEVGRIERHRFLNKEIKREMKVKHEMHEGRLRRAAKRERVARLTAERGEADEEEDDEDKS